MLYPTARAWVQDVSGAGGVQVGVRYSGTATTKPVGNLNPKPGSSWELSTSFNVQPQFGTIEAGVRAVRFVYTNTSRNSDYRISGLYVDPRLSH
jgi:hypothetical protein